VIRALPGFRTGNLEIAGHRLEAFPSPISGTWQLGSVTISGAQVLALILVPITTVGLWWLLGHTKFGEAVRASVANPDLARLTGISPKMVSTAVWSIAGFLSALSVVLIALIARITRTSVLEVMNEDYIRTARAKGQTEGRVLRRHALANAAVSIVTVIGLGVAALIGGVVVTESVYTIPGLGRLTVDAVLARDYPTIQAVILLFSLAYVLINLVVDMTYTFFDPRIRY